MVLKPGKIHTAVVKVFFDCLVDMSVDRKIYPDLNVGLGAGTAQIPSFDS